MSALDEELGNKHSCPGQITAFKFLAVEPGFVSSRNLAESELRSLVDEAHRLEIYVTPFGNPLTDHRVIQTCL